MASDLRLRDDVAVTPIVVDVAGCDAGLAEFLDSAKAALDSIDAVLITAGAIAAADEGTNDWSTTSMLVDTNMVGVMKLAGKAIAVMEVAGRGTVVLFSSITVAAPRDRNVAYAAAKAGLESYGRSMRYRLAGTPVSIQVYVLGYVDTAMTRDQKLRLPPADPAKVARRVISDLESGSKFVYEPHYWGVIVRVLRALPWPVYRRLKF